MLRSSVAQFFPFQRSRLVHGAHAQLLVEEGHEQGR